MKQLGLLVPAHTLTWYGPGQRASGVRAGSILLVDHGGAASNFIRFGQKIESLTNRSLHGYTWNDHAAVVIQNDVVSEMGPKGHELRSLADYDDHVYCVIELAVSDEQRALGLAYDLSCHTVEYGWFQYPAFFVNAVGFKFVGGWGSSIICSTHVTMVATAMGLFPTLPPSGVIPAHLSLWFGATNEHANVARFALAA